MARQRPTRPGGTLLPRQRHVRGHMEAGEQGQRMLDVGGRRGRVRRGLGRCRRRRRRREFFSVFSFLPEHLPRPAHRGCAARQGDLHPPRRLQVLGGLGARLPSRPRGVPLRRRLLLRRRVEARRAPRPRREAPEARRLLLRRRVEGGARARARARPAPRRRRVRGRVEGRKAARQGQGHLRAEVRGQLRRRLARRRAARPREVRLRQRGRLRGAVGARPEGGDGRLRFQRGRGAV